MPYSLNSSLLSFIFPHSLIALSEKPILIFNIVEWEHWANRAWLNHSLVSVIGGASPASTVSLEILQGPFPGL